LKGYEVEDVEAVGFQLDVVASVEVAAEESAVV
jgi:hypothetical protein